MNQVSGNPPPSTQPQPPILYEDPQLCRDITIFAVKAIGSFVFSCSVGGVITGITFVAGISVIGAILIGILTTLGIQVFLCYYYFKEKKSQESISIPTETISKTAVEPILPSKLTFPPETPGQTPQAKKTKCVSWDEEQPKIYNITPNSTPPSSKEI